MKYNQGIVDFFKRHNMYEEKMFNYLEDNTTMLDYRDPEQRDFVGCFYVQNKKNILSSLHINIPYVYDELTALIDVHEITHGIENYRMIGKKFKKNITVEVLPILYEKLYILDNNSDRFRAVGKYLDEMIGRDSAEEYLLALKMRDELLKNYNYDMHKMQKLSKKLVKKYR